MDVLKKRKRKHRSKLASCFGLESGDYGWCATCDPKAKRPGTPGYCGTDQFGNATEAQIVTKNSKNWGFCNKECRVRPSNSEYQLMVMN